jgi:orotidine-5'-phosphate decarboxylase
MSNKTLTQLIKDKKNFLSLGLDLDPSLLKGESPTKVCKRIIDSTIDWVVIYKINLAFFEFCDIDVTSICNYIKERGSLVIIDGKRGDIGNTSSAYAKVMYDKWNADGCTLNPYMGYDSVNPFLEYKDKFSILLALTSNPSVDDFQTRMVDSGLELWEEVISKSLDWSRESELWFVMGGNRIEEIKKTRQRGIENFLLVPGFGHQGGDLENIIKSGMTSDCGLIINASRSIIYSDNPKKMVQEISKIMYGYL